MGDDEPVFDPPALPSPNADGALRSLDDIERALRCGQPVTERERRYFFAALDFAPCATCAAREALQSVSIKKATGESIAARRARAREWKDTLAPAAIKLWQERGRLSCRDTIRFLQKRGQCPEGLSARTVRRFLAELRRELAADGVSGQA